MSHFLTGIGNRLAVGAFDAVAVAQVVAQN
jgi:hypothetical protein